MKYLEDVGRIRISCGEMVRIARARSALVYIEDELERSVTRVGEGVRLQLTGHQNAQTLEYVCTSGGVAYTITCEVDDIRGREITLLLAVEGDPTKPDPTTVAYARGMGFAAAYMLEATCGGQYKLQYMYLSPLSITPHIVKEEPEKGAPQKFFEKLLLSLDTYAAPEIDRVSRRLPTMRGAKFPFTHAREGQMELMETVYSTVKHHRKLYACAPTGIGKTMSVLYPAIRALGEGHTEKVFYLTPKNTTALAAAEALEKLYATGTLVRGVRLVAKDTICPNLRICAVGEKCKLSPNAPKREDEAVKELLALDKAVIGQQEMMEAARRHSVCPYELSLRYSMYCDVVICDYNYLFDPRVALKRYFNQGGHFTFLVDEAHNLVERAREIYGTTLTLTYLKELMALLGDLPEERQAAKDFATLYETEMKGLLRGEVQTDSKGEKHAFASTKELPHAIYEGLCGLVYVLEDACMKKLPITVAIPLRRAYYHLRNIFDKWSLYDDHFITFAQFEGGDLILRTLCLDPSDVLAMRLSLGDSAVLFSATLTPLSYYREILGGDRHSPTLEIPSPFEEEHLCVAVMDKVSTRYMEREDTVRAVVRAILTCVKAKPGNYMVFCPSYHYMTLIHDALHKALPALPTLVQKKDMAEKERQAVLAAFDANPKAPLVGFCVMGGIYSEGVDLVGKRLIGAIVVGVGLPTLCDEREAIRVYFDEKNDEGRAFAYVYPGMNRVLQAAGRVIRTEEDRGVVLLIDDRFGEPTYRNLIPAHWRGLHFVGDGNALTHLLKQFWQKPKG